MNIDFTDGYSTVYIIYIWSYVSGINCKLQNFKPSIDHQYLRCILIPVIDRPLIGIDGHRLAISSIGNAGAGHRFNVHY